MKGGGKDGIKMNHHMSLAITWVWKKNSQVHAPVLIVAKGNSHPFIPVSYHPLQFLPHFSSSPPSIKPHWVELVSLSYVELWCSTYYSLTLVSVIPSPDHDHLSLTCNPWNRAKDNTLCGIFIPLTELESYRLSLDELTLSLRINEPHWYIQLL